jgi:signal transduction histidine kinase
VAAAAIVAATGLGVAFPNALALGSGSLIAVVATALGIVLGLALVASAALMYRSDISTPHTLRVAGWNTLGVVVLGLVLLIAAQYPDVSLPLPVAATILGVSAVAHVLIGVNDVRRIRAGELAREREKLAVINRLARHNLRNQAQVLTSAGEIVADEAESDRVRTAAERITESARRVAAINHKLGEFQEAAERRSFEGSVSLPAIVEEVVDDYRAAYPDAAITVSVPDVSVRATPHLSVAVDELLENAFEHGDAATAGVEVSASVEGDTVTLSVDDDGAGVPADEWELVAGERDQTQLEHASGLGLWVVRAVVESFDGRLEPTEDRTGVRMHLQRA